MKELLVFDKQTTDDESIRRASVPRDQPMELDRFLRLEQIARMDIAEILAERDADPRLLVSEPRRLQLGQAIAVIELVDEIRRFMYHFQVGWDGLRGPYPCRGFGGKASGPVRFILRLIGKKP